MSRNDSKRGYGYCQTNRAILLKWLHEWGIYLSLYLEMSKYSIAVELHNFIWSAKILFFLLVDVVLFLSEGTPSQDGAPPAPPQTGRYASCGHAGGLSSSVVIAMGTEPIS